MGKSFPEIDPKRHNCLCLLQSELPYSSAQTVRQPTFSVREREREREREKEKARGSEEGRKGDRKKVKIEQFSVIVASKILLGCSQYRSR